MRRTPTVLLLLPLLVLALALSAAPASAQSSGASPFAPQTETTPPVADADRDDTGISGATEALIILAGVALVVGIGIVIARDARSRAGTERERVRDGRPQDATRRGSEPALAGDGGPARRPPRAKQQARKRAKVARASRKRNR